MPDDPRAKLRAAIAGRDTAKERHTTACRAEEHGQRLLAEARAALNAISSDERQLADQRAQALVDHASGEGPAPRYETATDLAARREVKGQATQRIETAEAALSVLEENKKAAERACAEANSAVAEAISKVVLLEQDRLAARMVQARQMLCEAYDSLKHLSMVWIPRLASPNPNQPTSPLQPIPFSALARNQMELSEPIAADYRYRQGINPRSISLEAWNQWQRALLSDADAAAPSVTKEEKAA
jgi:hypothetical protein